MVCSPPLLKISGGGSSMLGVMNATSPCTPLQWRVELRWCHFLFESCSLTTEATSSSLGLQLRLWRVRRSLRPNDFRLWQMMRILIRTKFKHHTMNCNGRPSLNYVLRHASCNRLCGGMFEGYRTMLDKKA